MLAPSRATRAALALLLLAAASAAAASKKEVVPSLTAASFDDHLKAHDLVLVKFFAPWCGHCKSMKEDFEKAAEELAAEASLADVDATIEKDLASKFGIQGFPTLKLFHKAAFLADYQGPRDKKSLVAFVRRALEPATAPVASRAALADELAKHRNVPVFVSVKPSAEDAAAYNKLAMEARESSTSGDATPRFLIAESEDVVAEHTPADHKLIPGDVLAFPPVDEDDEAQPRVPAVFDSLNEDTDLPSFIKAASVPILGELTRENAGRYARAGGAVLLAFIDGTPADDLKKAMKTAAKRAKADGLAGITFVFVDVKALKQFQEYMGLAGRDPAIAIYVFGEDSKFLLDFAEGEAVSADKLYEFARKYVAGEIKPTLKSEPIPEKNDDPVKVVVGNSWDAIVMDKTKDVLVEQYAPWCGHCKKLTPIYEELAEKLKAVDTIVIAKMDATANDAPKTYKARGFPTIQFFPAGDEKVGVTYSGERTVEGFISFLEEHATHKFNVAGNAPTDKAAGDEAKEEAKEEL